jgi:hypothetical protein
VIDTAFGRAIIATVSMLRAAPGAEPVAALLDGATPLPLGASGPWYRIAAGDHGRFLLTIETAELLEADARAGIVHYRHVNVWGLPFTPSDNVKAVTRRLGAHDWIPRVPTGTSSRYVVLVPEGAKAVDIKLTLAPDSEGPVTLTAVSLEPLGRRTKIQPFEPPADESPRSDLRVAAIADTFTVTALRYEAHVCALSQGGWRTELDSFRPDLVLIESAWNGNDGEWLYCVAGLKPDDQRLRAVVAHARALGVPVLFWNKEDPAHYDDFLEAARLCDVIATTDARTITRYVADVGHDRVFALPFCVQPDIHNPRVRRGQSSERITAAVFLGSWWASKFDARRQAQEQLFSGSIDFGLEIFDRYLTFDQHERYRFAPEWLPYVHGTLTYDQALEAYRRYDVVLNVNTVTDSETMFSRRALEASACGALVVTNPSVGTTAALGDLAISAATADECRSALAHLADTPGERDRRAHLAYRHTLGHHTWADRLDDVAQHCNVAFPSRHRPKVSVVLATKRVDGADRLLRYLSALDDQGADIEPILLTAFDPTELTALAEIEHLGARVDREGPNETLGACLNRGAAMATGGLIAKIDDDDLYGPRYFADLCLALDYSRADIVGKNSHYQYFEANDSTVLRYPGSEHTFTTFVCGSTLLVRSEVYEKIRFPQRRVGEDTEFLRRADAAGLRIFSADRFNYVSQRRADLSSHTWRAEHDALLTGETSRHWCEGLPVADLEI